MAVCGCALNSSALVRCCFSHALVLPIHVGNADVQQLAQASADFLLAHPKTGRNFTTRYLAIKPENFVRVQQKKHKKHTEGHRKEYFRRREGARGARKTFSVCGGVGLRWEAPASSEHGVAVDGTLGVITLHPGARLASVCSGLGATTLRDTCCG